MARIRCSERIKEGLRRAEMTQADLCRLPCLDELLTKRFVGHGQPSFNPRAPRGATC